MDTNIAKKFSDVACEARRKANYLRMRPSDSSLWNYEQSQGGPEALEDIAKKIDTLIATYFIHAKLVNNKQMMEAVSRQCRRAIQREVRRKKVREEYAELL